MGLEDWVGAAGDLLLGAQCPGCGSAGWGLCRACRRAVSGPAYLTRPDPSPPRFPLTATAGVYGPIMKRLISAHKEQQVLTLTPFLAERLAAAVEELLRCAASPGTTPVTLVPVPSSPAVVRSRGFDATWAMARLAARTRPCGAAVVSRRLLGLSRRVEDQAGLGAAARRENLAGSFRVVGSPVVRGGVLVVVDDVVTTGSSLAEAARALTAAGFPVLGAATVAATVRSRATDGTTADDKGSRR